MHKASPYDPTTEVEIADYTPKPTVKDSIDWQDPEQITAESSRDLPKDLANELILFLKFDSVEEDETLEPILIRQRHGHNDRVPVLNKELRTSAKRYPFKYKIVSMTDPRNYDARNFHGAKYLFYMNSFTALHDKIMWSTNPDGPLNAFVDESRLGIINLQTRETYLLRANIAMGHTYKYSNMIDILNAHIKKQLIK